MNKTIIIIEDELLIAKDLKDILNEEGYDALISIGTVDHAIKLIEDLNPILVLIDINLRQDKDGIYIGNYLLKKDIIPYIYITSNSDKLTLDTVKSTRPHGFIVKPFRPIEITTTVSIVLNNYRHKKVDAHRNSEDMPNDLPFRIKTVINYINDNIFEKIDINELAAIAKWRPQYFIKIFTEYTGSTPYQYILIRKVEKAKSLMYDSDLTITDIAFDLGFHGYANFCKAFKKIEGTTPEQYKKKALVSRYFDTKIK